MQSRGSSLGTTPGPRRCSPPRSAMPSCRPHPGDADEVEEEVEEKVSMVPSTRVERRDKKLTARAKKQVRFQLL